MATKMVLATLGVVALLGCTGEASNSPAVLQGSCPPLAVPVGNDCRLAKEVANLLGQDDAAKIKADLEKLNGHLINPQTSVKVVVTIKPGQGLIAATKGTALPLTTTKALELGKKYNRLSYHFIALDGSETFNVVLHPGEQLALVEEKGKLHWVLTKK